MLVLIIDAGVLVALLKCLCTEEIGFGTAFLIALAASIATNILAVVFFAAMGPVGILLAVVIAALLIGVVVSALFGAEIKRAFLIGGIFIVVHIGTSVGVHLAMAAAR